MAWTSPRTWVTGEVVTAALMNAHVRDNLLAGFPNAVSAASWTPTLEATTTNMDTTVTGRQWRVGPLQFVWARFVCVGAAPGGQGLGTLFVTLPSTASGVTGDAAMGQVVGSWAGLDAGTVANSEAGSVYLRSSTTVGFRRPVGTNAGDAQPFTWTTSDILTFQAVYPVA